MNKRKWKIYWSYESVSGMEEGTKIINAANENWAQIIFNRYNEGFEINAIEEITD